VSLIVDSITKCFGSVVALDGVSFSVEPGRIFGLLGANGAGKTTCMRIVLDILRAELRCSWSPSWRAPCGSRRASTPPASCSTGSASG
jgi:ABC-2 type transport system ATP-binding protein